jgi:hypothetical protein
MAENVNYIDALNLNEQLDFFTCYNRVYHDNVIDDDPYYAMQISSNFYDIESLSRAEFVKNTPIYISINIQSLQSKFDQLCMELNDCEEQNISISPRNMGCSIPRVVLYPRI